MRFFRALSLSLLTLPVIAQTYTPKAVVIEGPVDKAEALHIANISAGTLTKDQIEAALGRLADTGMYADLSYKVDGSALTIVLKPSAAAQLQPVVFANLVWWKPGELEPLIEARVPAYHGKLPAAGTLTQQVEDALTALLHEKGVDDVKLDARETGSSAAATTISIESPTVTIGTFTLQQSVPALDKNITNFANTLHGEDFDTGATAQTIWNSAGDMYQNAGYLEETISTPEYAAPRKTSSGYEVDITATVTPGPVYRVAALNITPTPPAALDDLTKAAAIKPGDLASPLAMRIAKGEMELIYWDASFYDAKATIETAKDSSAHTVTYSVRFEIGQPYHFGKLDLSELTQSQQADFLNAFHAAPGAPAGKPLITALHNAALDAHIGLATFETEANHADHSVTVTLKLKAARR